MEDVSEEPKNSGMKPSDSPALTAPHTAIHGPWPMAMASTDLGHWLAVAPSGAHSDALMTFALSLGSDHTRRAYLSDLKQFLVFLKALEPPLPENWHIELEAGPIHSWRNQMMAQGLSPKTIHRKLTALAAFLNFCERRGWTQTRPMERVKRPRVALEGKTPFMQEHDAEKVLRAAWDAHRASTPGGFLQRVTLQRAWILETLLGTGIRVSSLCGLKCGDLRKRGSDWVLHIRGKGSKTHEIVLHPDLGEGLWGFRCARHPPTHPLFENLRVKGGKPLTPSGVATILAVLGKEAELPLRLTPHVCRATVATLLHRKGVPLTVVQSFLNHEDPQTTALYIRRVSQEADGPALRLPWHRHT